MKYKVGQKVRIRKDLKEDIFYGEEKFVGDMACFLGKIMTIEAICNYGHYNMEELKDYCWDDEMIEGPVDEAKVYTFKSGDILTLSNGKTWFVNLETTPVDNYQRMMEHGEIVKHQRYVKHHGCVSDIKTDIIETSIDFYTLETIYEKKEILDKEEKEYLRAVIKPFRNEIEWIKKEGDRRFAEEKEYLVIKFNDQDRMAFKSFEKGTMYKGMETGKEYSLDELGL